MKRFTTFKLSLTTLVVAGLMLSLGGVAKALPACYVYGQATGVTPVFNNICDVGQGLNSTSGVYPIGNERDFVRIRPDVSGDVTSNATNPKLQDSLAAACNTGDKFDIWTYVHNNASPDSNDNGTGTGVAKDVKLALAASGINTTASDFTFGGTISASNAETVTDTATLNCNGKQVKLTLVPSSVHYNNTTSAPSWQGLSDSFVNSTNSLGNPIFGSGDQWGCYDFRTIVVYQVTVTEIPPTVQPPTLQCTIKGDEFVIDQQKHSVTVGITANVTNATVTGYNINWGDNTSSTKQSDTHVYDSHLNSATIRASFTARLADGTVQTVTGAECIKNVSFTTPAKPKVLPNTGAGSTLGLFAATFAIATVGYRYFLGRRLNAN